MSSLINRIQRAMLGSAGPEKVRALLAELQIPAGGSGGSMREVRRGFLRPISDEAILRDALTNIGLTGGGGGGARSLSNIRTAILHNLRDCETTLRDGLDAVLAPEDLAGGESGPEWVPADAKIHIDFVGGSPQGRAWVDGTGEVEVGTLIGNDPDADNIWDTTYAFDSGSLSADGYSLRSAIIGAAHDLAAAGSTMVFRIYRALAPTITSQNVIAATEDGATTIQITVASSSGTVTALGTVVDLTVNFTSAGPGGLDCLATTLVANRVDLAANGGTAGSDGFTSLALDVFILEPAPSRIQSITIYDPLANTTGLSELSEVA